MACRYVRRTHPTLLGRILLLWIGSMNKYQITIRDVQSFDHCQPCRLNFQLIIEKEQLNKLFNCLADKYPKPQYEIEITKEIISHEQVYPLYSEKLNGLAQ